MVYKIMIRYWKEQDLNGSSVEEWARKQIKWLLENKKKFIQKNYEDGTKEAKFTYTPYGMKCMEAAAKRVPLTFDRKEIMMTCACQVDRIAIAVMIVYILWFLAKDKKSKRVSIFDVGELFLSDISKEQWHMAWEEQKYISASGSLENMLDNESFIESLKFDE